MTAQAAPSLSSSVFPAPGSGAPAALSDPITIDWLSRYSVTSPTRSSRSAWSTRSTGIPLPRQMDCMWPVSPPAPQTTARAATIASYSPASSEGATRMDPSSGLLVRLQVPRNTLSVPPVSRNP